MSPTKDSSLARATLAMVAAATGLFLAGCDPSSSRATTAVRTNAPANPPAAVPESAPILPEPAPAAASVKPLTAQEIAVAEPDFSTTEPAIEKRLREQRAAFDRLGATNTVPSLRAEAWGKLGLLYFAHEFPASAAACFTNAVFNAPADHRTWYGLAECRLEDEDHEGAIAAMEVALRQMNGAPNATLADQGSARRFLGDVLERSDRLPEALAQFETALVLDRNDVYSQVKAGQIHALTGSGPAALEYLENALRRAPRNQTILSLLTQEYRRNGQPERAAALLSAVKPGAAPAGPLVRPDPWRRYAAELVESPMVLIRRANRLNDAGRPLRAIAAYEAALRLQPTNSTAGINLAGALLKVRRPREARRIAEEVAARGDDSRELRYNLAVAQARTGATNEALKIVQTWRQDQPDDALALQLEATVRESSGDWAGAQAALEQYLQRKPGAVPTVVRLARLQARGGKPEDARQTLETAFQRSPQNPRLRHELARLLALSSKAQVRQPARAVELMTPLVAAQPGLPQAETMILALNSSGDSAAALERFNGLTNALAKRTNAVLQARLERLRKAIVPGAPVYEPWPFALHAGSAEPDDGNADELPDKTP